MKSMTEVEIIRVYLGESARKDARPIYQLIIELRSIARSLAPAFFKDR